MGPKRKEPSDESTSTKGSGRSQSTAPSDHGSDADTGKPAILPELTPPSAAEAKYYYMGLPSSPRLVGRTTAGVVRWKGVPNANIEWAHPDYDPDPEVLLATPIGGPHRVLDKIEGLLPALKEAIHVLSWTSIDLLRLGSSKLPMTERPVVLWIGVQSDHRGPWETVAQALRRVRRVLDSADLMDVECEIRKAEVVPQGPPPVFAPDTSDEFTNEWLARRQLTTALGQAIIPAAQQEADTGGTLCLYVRAASQANAPIWALTCRHVCLPLAHHANERFRRTNASRSHAMYMPSNKVLNEAIGLTEDGLASTEQALRKLEAKARDTDGGADARTTKRIEQRKEQISDIHAFMQTLRDLLPRPARDIGWVLFSPPLQAMLGPDGKPWARDWGVVKLKADKFPRQYTKNEVSLQDFPTWQTDEKSLMAFFARTCQLPAGYALPADGLLPIQGVVSLGELDWMCSGRADRPAPQWCQREDDSMTPADVRIAREAAAMRSAPAMFDREESRVLIVGKRGKTTGLTWGAVNEFRSVVRTPHVSMEPFESRELAIVGTLNDRSSPFSAPGDSGSLVFDITGRAVAMLTAGSQNMPGRFDVSYATPLALVLEDVAQEMGQPVRLL